MSEKLKPLPSHIEPEYVGAHSALITEECMDVLDKNADDSEAPFVAEFCGEPATHTLVAWVGGELQQRSVCDECGNPGDADGLRHKREWTGVVVSDV